MEITGLKYRDDYKGVSGLLGCRYLFVCFFDKLIYTIKKRKISRKIKENKKTNYIQRLDDNRSCIYNIHVVVVLCDLYIYIYIYIYKDHTTPPQHVTPVRRQILPASPSKPSPQKKIQDSNNNQMESKNLQTASILNGSQQTNQIKNVLEFIQKTMETLSTYAKQFQRAARYRDDPDRNVTNISKHSFINDVDELFKHKQTLPRNNISQHENNIMSEFSKR